MYQHYPKKDDPNPINPVQFPLHEPYFDLPPLDRNSTAMMTKSQYGYPIQDAHNRSFDSESSKPFGSSETKTSVSSSMTNVSSAWTTPNTSFSARSLATSFDASVDGTGTTIRGSWENPSRPPLLGHSVSGSESDVVNWYEVEKSNGTTDKIRAPSDPMDLDSESSETNGNALKAETLYQPREVEAQTSETIVHELLAARLRANCPFGEDVQLLHLYSSLLIPVKSSSSSSKLSVSAISTTL